MFVVHYHARSLKQSTPLHLLYPEEKPSWKCSWKKLPHSAVTSFQSRLFRIAGSRHIQRVQTTQKTLIRIRWGAFLALANALAALSHFPRDGRVGWRWQREEIDWDVSLSEADIKTVCAGNEEITVRVSRDQENFLFDNAQRGVHACYFAWSRKMVTLSRGREE